MRKTMPASPSLSPILTAVPVAERRTATKWTVMVFMGAETEEGNAPMLQPAADDLVEMATVGSGAPLKVFAQVHTHDEVRGGLIDRRRIDALKRQGIKALDPVRAPNRADGKALGWFLERSLKAANHDSDDPTHCSMLVLWGHAYDFAIGKAPTRSGTPDALDFVELGGTLSRLQRGMKSSLKTSKAPKLDVIAFDACDVATGEVACELAPFADYLLGSQVGVPIPGWPYDEVLGRLRAPYGDLMIPVEFGTWVVNRFCESYALRRAVSLSMLDLTRAGELSDRVGILAVELRRFIKENFRTRELVSEMFSRSAADIDKPYVDIADLCLNLVRECGDPLINAAARALGDFVVAPSVDVSASAPRAERYPFVTAQGRNAGETAKLNGVSLYAPHVAPDYDYLSVRELYGRFTLSKRTQWDALVHDLAG